MGEERREVKREVELEAPPAEVWEALVDPRLLSEWLAGEVEMEAIPGAPAPADSVFAALADPTRRRVIETLAGGATVTASGLAVELPISRQAIAKHLATLTRARLVRPSRVGRETRYSLDAAPLEDAAR